MKLSQIPTQFEQKASNMKRYYLVYCRKSSESEDRQVSSIEDQLKILLEIAKQRKLPILRQFTESKSAKEPGRPQFGAMMQLIAKRNDIKGILCWKLNRLHRNPKDAGDLQWILQSGKIEEVITPSKVYTEADSDFVMAVEGAQANRFIRDLREDTLRGLNSKLEKGIAPILAPVGYLNDKTKNQGERDIIPHPQYFKLLRKIFDLALTGDYSIFELCRMAESMGIRNCKGVPISRTRMYEVLQNPFYAGRFIYKGILHQGTHQALLTEAEFDLLQDFVASRSHAHTKNNDCVFNGFIRCGYCNFMITNEFKKKHYKNGTVGNFNYYRCSQKRLDRCPQPYIRVEKLEEQVAVFLSQIKLSPKFVNWAIKELNRTNEEVKQQREAQYQVLKKAYEVAQTKIQNLFNLRISPENTNQELITDSEYKEQRQKLLIERESVKQKIQHMDEFVDDFDELTVKTFDFTVKAIHKWEHGTLEDKRMILSTIGAGMVLKDYQLTIEPRTPFLMIKNTLEKSIIGPKDYAQPTHEPFNMSVVGDRRELNPQPPDPQSGALPLSYDHRIFILYQILTKKAPCGAFLDNLSTSF